MKVIVCGAGEIGSQICLDLNREEDCDLTVIDRDADLLRMLTDRLGATGITGEAGDPDVLKSAGAQEAGLIIAATPSDHANIVFCLVARSLKSKAYSMARLGNSRLLDAVGSGNSRWGPVDEAINPESRLAEHTLQLLESPSLIERRPVLSDASGDRECAILCGMRVGEECALLNTPLRQLSELFGDLNALVVGFRRRNRLGIALAEDQLFAGDEVYLFASSGDLERTVSLFGKSGKGCSSVVLAGAGRVGMHFARRLDSSGPRFRLKVIEADRRRAEAAADALSRTVVLHGNAMNTDVLEEAGIRAADAIVAVTQDDRTNLLVASQAKKIEDKLFAVSLVNDKFLMPLADQLEIDALINPRGAVMSRILGRCRGRGISSVGFIGDRDAEVIEATITDAAGFEGKKIREAGLPEGVLVGAVKKNGRIIKPEPDTCLEVGDRVAYFALTKDVPELLKQLDLNAAPA